MTVQWGEEKVVVDDSTGERKAVDMEEMMRRSTKVVDDIKVIAKKFACQLERGEEKGRLHWQVVLNLKIKKRKGEFVKLLRGSSLQGAHVSAGSNASGASFNYAMKADTRVLGPWTEEGSVEVKMPRDLEGWVDNKFPWQTVVRQDCTDGKLNRRDVNVICDIRGNGGKSTLMKYMDWKKESVFIPAMKETDRFIGFCMSMRESDSYMIDMPRAMDKQHLEGFWAGIEMLKSGMLYDWRNKGRQRMMSTPKIWILTNKFPDTRCLSADRWKIWMIDSEFKLVVYTHKRAENMMRYREITEHKVVEMDVSIDDDDYEKVFDDIPALPIETEKTIVSARLRRGLRQE